MTEFWVSQGNKWCDFCKIFISNNPSSIRNHELGQRHKDNVAQRLNSMREQKLAKEKEQKEAAHALEQIEAKAKRSYQKDMASFQEARDSNLQALVTQEWEMDGSSGYYYNQTSGFYYDPNSGFYYTEALGKWVPQEEALASICVTSGSIQKKLALKKPSSSETGPSTLHNKGSVTSQSAPPPGPVVSNALNPMRTAKGAPSKLTLHKRKRQDEKPKVVSAEEVAALKAREAAKKRVEEREKSLLGLYKH
ncbi:zinc finger protein ZOP1-like isoform X3 [Coffea arabica]|uniref:Zinc finger protein ZOP1-like isoform X3 n=1 Tax=Coffea arabica TaxID=13443 RepID=A0A6P6WES8_COFAR